MGGFVHAPEHRILCASLSSWCAAPSSLHAACCALRKARRLWSAAFEGSMGSFSCLGVLLTADCVCVECSIIIGAQLKS